MPDAATASLDATQRSAMNRSAASLFLANFQTAVDARVLADGNPPSRPVRDRPQPEVLRERDPEILSAANSGDRVHDERASPAENELVVRLRLPREHRVLLAPHVEIGHERDRLDRVRAVERRFARRVLEERAEAHQERQERHVRVGLVRLANADRVAELPSAAGAASRTCSHVAGDWPIEFHRSCRQMIGAGTK